MPDRDAKGYFVKGCKPGPGRPPKELERHRLRIISDAVSDEDLDAITRRAVTDALDGDRHARAWIVDRLVGRPIETRVNVADPVDPRAAFNRRMDAQGKLKNVLGQLLARSKEEADAIASGEIEPDPELFKNPLRSPLKNPGSNGRHDD